MVRYISEFQSPLLTAVSLHLHMWCPCIDCIKERLYFSSIWTRVRNIVM